MSNDEMLATWGSAAKRLSLKPGATLNAFAAVSPSSLAGMTLREPAGPALPPPSWAKDAVATVVTTRANRIVRIGRECYRKGPRARTMRKNAGDLSAARGAFLALLSSCLA